jgi:hypothetical protein
MLCITANLAANGSDGSWLCKNAETRDGDRMNILRNRTWMRKDSPAHSVTINGRKTILVASQFFAFLHSLGQFLPRHLAERAAALPHKAAAPTVRYRGSYGPEAVVLRCSK